MKNIHNENKENILQIYAIEIYSNSIDEVVNIFIK